MKLIKNNPLFIVFVIPIIVDVIGTVIGQPKEYWTTGYKVVNEALPIYPLLQLHPLLFIVFCLSIWLPFTFWLVLKLKKPLNIWATMSLLIGHGYNSVFWLRKDLFNLGFSDSLIPMTIYILLIGFIASKGLTHYFKK